MNKPDFIGLDTSYLNAEGDLCRRIHLDGAASPLAATTALKALQDYLPHYSNVHSHVHASAQISTEMLHWAQHQLLTFVNADPVVYTAVLMGSGTTACVNRVARGLASMGSGKKTVLVSAMEHHANDLPHRQFGNEIKYLPLEGESTDQGAVSLIELEKILKKEAHNIAYIAVSAVSNVTGIINPIASIVELAHQHNVLVLVDAAQAVAHLPISLSNEEKGKDQKGLLDADADFFIFSGHKLYTPASPGVLIAKKSVLSTMSGQDLGGGSVSDVSYYDFDLDKDFPAREQSGTPNIAGAVALASVVQELGSFGLHNIWQHNQSLMEYLLNELANIKGLTIYGAEDAERIGAIAFNHADMDHGLLAAILNDYYMIAVRNECFCAHPYVSSMLKQTLWDLELDDIPLEKQQSVINRKRGMVRVSISLYNEKRDIEKLIHALHEIFSNKTKFLDLYEPLYDGSYRHTDYVLEWQDHLLSDK